MSRLLFLLAVVVVVYWLLKRYRKQPPKPDSSAASEDMVRCAQCGMHLPKSESITSGGKSFCSDAHRREFEAK
jgi:uncharacterized protein